MDIKDTDLAHIAGIIDGEGCLTANVRKPNIKSREVNGQIVMQLVVAMCDLPIIQWISEVTGTNKIYSYEKKNKTHKDSHHWRPTMGQLRVLLPKLIPYMKVKKVQAENFVKLLEIRSQSTRSKSRFEEQLVLQQEIKKLNKRGK